MVQAAGFIPPAGQTSAYAYQQVYDPAHPNDDPLGLGLPAVAAHVLYQGGPFVQS